MNDIKSHLIIKNKKIYKYIYKKEEQFKKLKKNNKKLGYEYEFFFHINVQYIDTLMKDFFV